MAADKPLRDESGDPLLAALEEVIAATRAVREALRESEVRTRENIARLRAGEPLAEVVRDAPVSMARTEINEAVDRLTTARQASRATIFRQLAEDGMTRKEIASKWGFSQQVVSRVVNYAGPATNKGPRE